MKSIAVLLTVHNRKEKTLCCLQNLFKQEVPADYQMDVYLTDDGCTDGTPEAIRTQYPQVHIIKGDGNLFWNRGMYTAWKIAAGSKDYDFYFWLNDDTIIRSQGIKQILKCSDIKNNQAIITGLISSIKNKNITTFGGRKKGIKIQNNGTMQIVNSMHGNMVLIPRYVFHIIGFNDPYYNHAYGDHDYSLMAKEKGIKVFTTDTFVGECELDNKTPKCFNPSITLWRRLQILKTPLAYAKPNEIFYFERKHYNTFQAILKFIGVYIRCLFPKIWTK